MGQCQHCNDKKSTAKRVSDMSSDLFFAVFVKVKCFGSFKFAEMIVKSIYGECYSVLSDKGLSDKNLLLEWKLINLLSKLLKDINFQQDILYAE